MAKTLTVDIKIEPALQALIGGFRERLSRLMKRIKNLENQRARWREFARRIGAVACEGCGAWMEDGQSRMDVDENSLCPGCWDSLALDYQAEQELGDQADTSRRPGAPRHPPPDPGPPPDDAPMG